MLYLPYKRINEASQLVVYLTIELRLATGKFGASNHRNKNYNMESKKELQITLSQTPSSKKMNKKLIFVKKMQKKSSGNWKIKFKLPNPKQHKNHQQFPQMVQQNLDKQL